MWPYLFLYCFEFRIRNGKYVWHYFVFCIKTAIVFHNLQRCLYWKLAFNVRVFRSPDTEAILNVSVSPGLKLVVVTTISSPTFQSTAVSKVTEFDPLSAVSARWVQVTLRGAPNRSRPPKTAAMCTETYGRHVVSISTAFKRSHVFTSACKSLII